MKAWIRNEWPKTFMVGGLIPASTIIAATLSVAATKVANSSLEPVAAAATQPAPTATQSTQAPAIRFSPPVAEVLRLVDAKVDPAVIKAFIHNYPAPYRLSAEQIIALKNRGVSSDIIAAMLQHGSDLTTPAISQPAPGPAPYGPAPAIPDQYSAVPAPAYPDYSNAYGPGYEYPLGYPYDYWGYNNLYGYPWGFGWPLGYYGLSPFYFNHFRNHGFFNRGFGTGGRFGRFGGFPGRGGVAGRPGGFGGGFRGGGGFGGGFHGGGGFGGHGGGGRGR